MASKVNRTSSIGSNDSRSNNANPNAQSSNTAPSASAKSSSSAAAASASLSLLLREDALLTQHELHIAGKSEQAAFSYAAALLDTNDQHQVQQKAKEALGETERKLALVESLAERVSRTSPEAVAGPLLRLHGYTVETEQDRDASTTTTTTTSGSSSSSSNNNNNTMTLVATRERCNRLKRQGEVMEGVARRVESSLQRGLKRMDAATSRLSRVLDLSATLKMILRLQFEASKLQGYDLDDTRDLTRAAASVAIVKDLLLRPELQQGQIEVVEAMRPEMENTARQVRRAAASLLAQHHDGGSRSSAAALHLGATLQVYYHLGELPQAAWSAVTHALKTAQAASDAFWSPSALTELMEKAQTQARAALSSSSSSSGSKKPITDATLNRSLKKNLRELRADAASKWAAGITDAANQVWNLHRVLCRKSDPVTRQVFVDVVSQAHFPQSFEDFERDTDNFNIFTVFWNKLCMDMGRQVEELLQYENGKLASDVAALYPAVRAAALNMLGSLYDTMQASNSTGAWDDTGAAATASVGILGGSAVLDHALWTSQPDEAGSSDAAFGMVSADTWTRTDTVAESEGGNKDQFASSGTTTSLSSIFHSDEWKVLQASGLLALQEAFLSACSARLCEPLQYMFPEGVTVDEDGIPMSVLPSVPSRYDIQKLDSLIRAELSLADPREGGGELSMATMMAEVVVGMIERFCNQAKGAVSNVGEKCIRPEDGTATEALAHDLKVASVMNLLATSLRNAPENTFIAPYRPSTNLFYEEAASACQVALLPALYEIENLVTTLILSPLCKALNRRVGAAIAKMHYGTYFEDSLDGMDGMGTSFVQKHLCGLYDGIADEHLSSLPSEYAAILASTIAAYSIYTFVSNASLIRPLKETAKLHITQDLADFELALEQLVFKTGSSLSLSQVEQGKPYAELRAVRQMLFWSGLDDKTATAKSLSKAMLQEPWARDVRVSTACHFLFSFSPSLLSSPHHSKRLRPEEYVSELVRLDGSVDDGEMSAWMTTMACCDSYQQRESVGVGESDGDKRVATVVMTVGPELLRRRRQ